MRYKNETNKESIDLATDWRQSNTTQSARHLTILGIAFMSVLLPFDFLLFTNGGPFPPFRVGSIIVFTIFLLSLDKILARGPDHISIYWAQAINILPPLAFNLLYQTFYFQFPIIGHETILFIANFMVIFFSTFLLHRFKTEQLTLNFVSMIAFGYWISIYPDKMQSVLLFIITHLSSMLVTSYFRREFFKSLFERYERLKAFMPKQIARFMIVSNGQIPVEKAFPAKERFTTCLCCDWRSYQALLGHYGADQISEVSEFFYTKVFDLLDRIIPSGEYFASWTADELFVIFYSSEESRSDVMSSAATFAKVLATEVFSEMKENYDLDLQFDIGLAAGYGHLGVQGPKQLKKTTITGRPAGISKRLEAEAKSIRKSSANKSQFPILIMDDNLRETCLSKNIIPANELIQIVASAKDIQGKVFYKFQSASSEKTARDSRKESA